MQAPELSDYHLILGVGTKLINDYEWNEFKNKPNITFANWVPQRQILNSNKLEFAIIHGGLATIKECIYSNKKFLILPLGKDQIDNALRLRKLGIDNTIPIESISPKVLIDAMMNFKSDRKTIDNLKTLSEIFVKYEIGENGDTNYIAQGTEILIRKLNA